MNTNLNNRLVTVVLLDGTEAQFTVRQLPVGEYKRAFSLIDDEIGLTALICGHDHLWANNLSPDGYETLFAAAQEVNAKGFFAWSKRRQQRDADQQAAILPALMKMSPEQIRTAVAAGMQSVSPTSSPKPRP